ncbi:MAG: fibronectin type III domain-containing protein [Verrucomicrobiae bacterium]|nr:fibronectin type III domain-containing protein [Verrucomicrobiae bacterium]
MERNIPAGRIGRAGKTVAISLAFGLWSALASAWGQIAPDPSLGKPVPMEGTVTAVKGETMTIELVSDAKTRAAVVEFLIRDFPLNGKLGPMISHEEDRTRATIKYTAFDDTAATTDSFTYAVRYPGGLWSQKAKVDIKLEASEPTIHATAEADFGKVMIGQSKEMEVFLSNSGNAPYRNQIQLQPPWSIVEPEKGLLNLPVGGQQVVKVRYEPQIEGPAQYNLVFFRNQGASTQLKAAGYAPFGVESDDITLRWEEKSRTRIGTVTLNCNAPQLIPVALTTDERLKASGGGAMYLKPGEPATFQIYLPPTDVAPYEGQFQIAAGAYTVPISVKAGIAPAYLVVENTGTAEGSLDFGKIEPGGLAQGSFQLRNAGGTETKVKLSTEPPFAVLSAGGVTTMDPQEAEAFAVRVNAAEGISGLYEGTLWIEADNGQTLRVPLQAVFLGSNEDPNSSMPVFEPGTTLGGDSPTGTNRISNADRPPSAGKPATQEEIDQTIREMDQLRSPLGFITYPTVERKVDASVPSVARDKIKLLEEGKRHLTVGWELPGIGFDEFEIEVRMMRLVDADHIPESVWMPYHDVDYETEKEGEMSADIRGLNPNATYEFRVFTLGDDGKVSPPLAFAAKTKMPMDWTWIYVGFGVLVVGGIGFLIWWLLGNSSHTNFRIPGLSRARDFIHGLD